METKPLLERLEVFRRKQGYVLLDPNKISKYSDIREALPVNVQMHFVSIARSGYAHNSPVSVIVAKVNRKIVYLCLDGFHRVLACRRLMSSAEHPGFDASFKVSSYSKWCMGRDD
jgi:hypothetical protein